MREKSCFIFTITRSSSGFCVHDSPSFLIYFSLLRLTVYVRRIHPLPDSHDANTLVFGKWINLTSSCVCFFFFFLFFLESSKFFSCEYSSCWVYWCCVSNLKSIPRPSIDWIAVTKYAADVISSRHPSVERRTKKKSDTKTIAVLSSCLAIDSTADDDHLSSFIIFLPQLSLLSVFPLKRRDRKWNPNEILSSSSVDFVCEHEGSFCMWLSFSWCLFKLWMLYFAIRLQKAMMSLLIIDSRQWKSVFFRLSILTKFLSMTKWSITHHHNFLAVIISRNNLLSCRKNE